MENEQEKMNRRSFLRTTAVTGAGLAFSQLALGQTPSAGAKTDDINVALLGAGTQGKTLMNACLKIPGIRFKAVCDIWKNYNLATVSGTLNRYPQHKNNAYEDFQEMLSKEKDLQAVIIATPDFWHSRHTLACLEAGLHVYCEKEMANTLEGAKAMVESAKKTGKLLQIGHQRRSNPTYRYCYDNYIQKSKLLGKIAVINGQWNRSKDATEFATTAAAYQMDAATLKKYEYDSMEQFRNWRWFKGKGGGPIVDLGSHQIDIYSWFLGAKPKSVIASGGNDYWKNRQWYDNVMAVFEYETEGGSVRAFYQTISTNSGQGYFEQFMGIEGTLVLSEAANRCKLYREAWVEEKQWEQWVKQGIAKGPIEEKKPEVAKDATEATSGLNVAPSPVPPTYDIPVTLGDTPYHQPHLENFFNAVRGKEKLNCPAEVGYETAVTVLKVNEAIAAAKKLDYKPEEFSV